MNGNGTQQLYVSTFKMHIHSPGSGPRSVEIRPSERSTNTDSKRVDPPVFTKPLQDCAVDEGGDIILQGTVAGCQPIKVSWLHNGEVANFGQPSFNGREVKFVVKESLPEDAGEYTCLAENSVGRTSSCGTVKVRDFETIFAERQRVSTASAPTSKAATENGRAAPSHQEGQQIFTGSLGSSRASSSKLSPITSPREVIPKKRANSGRGPALQFKSPPRDLKAEAGQTARVTCLFTGTLPIASCWITNGEQIADGPEVWVENTDLSTTLVIAKARQQHAGRYTVLLKDRRNSAQHTLTLIVIERPQPPASCPVISPVSSTSLVLSWSGPCYDGGSAIQGYVVEVKDRGGAEPGEWREITAQCKSTSYKVSGLQPQQEYCFRVSAYNAVGISEPGPDSPVVRMEQKDSNKPAKEEQPEAYAAVTIDSSHKVSEHYNVLEKLGVGKFGQVFKLTHKETGRVYAGKFYKGRRAKEREAARKEIELMNHLHHPKLVQCLAAYDQSPEMVMVMEFIAGGELFERIVDDNFEHTELTSVHYMQQILEGITYMHQQKILHLDLKPENIVCLDTTGTSIKIIDFGLATKIESNTSLKVMQGTPEFVAPEVINYEPVSNATDMWSIGVICYILLSGESPFQGNDDAETLALVTAAQWEFDEESFDEISDEAKDFISSLLEKDPRKRMSCETAIAHSWMAAFESGELETKNLSKEKMKRYLARQKWKKAGKALLALKRMALLSKGDGSSSTPTTPQQESPLSPEAMNALKSLEHKMQEPPKFTQSLEDQTVAPGASARLSCHLTGYPDPEVVWLCGDEPVVETPMIQIEYEEDGRCTLILSKVGPGSSNVYTCKASNDHGETCCSAKLIVQE